MKNPYIEIGFLSHLAKMSDSEISDRLEKSRDALATNRNRIKTSNRPNLYAMYARLGAMKIAALCTELKRRERAPE